ncbi:hypothetical protein CC1G_15511 [Coprinopsis cinerea okayama7|uniref:Uncharacterized protein n=1 Tax=Coprinopsis cinerea (strain Okayama-7 / 130 / ATCC MYA-4618 / FGSC 9003) TaxID=240176 RepID=D6RN92_COPC7|nr:hypothetical protein CC1G_15511 [Coprinopsis cinerea okayama7\|eukprot:XP_002910970.1 hypothetical protein CC1G_15511 [Coprinopsis cinerea okayama7\
MDSLPRSVTNTLEGPDAEKWKVIHYKSAPQEDLLGDSRRRRKRAPAPAGESPAGAGGFTARAGKSKASSLGSPYTSREISPGKSPVLLRVSASAGAALPTQESRTLFSPGSRFSSAWGSGGSR